MNLSLFITILRARYSLVAATLAITVVTALVITDLLPRQYVATTSLVLNSTETPFEGSGSAAKTASTYMATQLDIMQSRSVALKVVDALEMTGNHDLQVQYAEAGGDGTLREWAAERLLKNLTVEPSRDSRVVALSYRSTDAQTAAQVANRFAHAYIETTLELMTDPARRNAEWFDQQLEVLRERLMNSQARLTDFQQEHGIISIDERLDTETNRLNELSRNYVQVQAEATDVRSRQLGENHPEFRRAISREQAVAGSFESQKQLLLQLKHQRDRLGVLAREVESDQRVFDSTLQRFYQTSLESQFNQPSSSVLTEAVPPLNPSQPMVAFNLIVAFVLGLLMGGGLAILAEFLDRRVRGPEDVSEGMQTRVLAVI